MLINNEYPRQIDIHITESNLYYYIEIVISFYDLYFLV